MGKRVVVGAVLLISFAAGPLQAQHGPVGAYEFRLCHGHCVEDDPSTTIARGVLVLFTDGSALESTDASVLPNASRWMSPRDSSVNACFRFTERKRYVGGRDLYAGIKPRGRTRWSTADTLIQVPLYASPDARFTLRGKAVGKDIVGETQQIDCCGGGVYSFGQFVARWMGPAKPELCTQGGAAKSSDGDIGGG